MLDPGWASLLEGFCFWTLGYPELFVKYSAYLRAIYNLPPGLFINYWKARPRKDYSYLWWRTVIFRPIIFKAFTNFLSACSLKGIEIHEGLRQGCKKGPLVYSQHSFVLSLLKFKFWLGKQTILMSFVPCSWRKFSLHRSCFWSRHKENLSCGGAVAHSWI